MYRKLIFIYAIIHHSKLQRIQLKIGTKNFERFTRVPIPITVKFYLFNITNKEQVLSGIELPKFDEVGPFVFKQWRRREIVDFEDYNRRIKYREYKTFYPVHNFTSLNHKQSGLVTATRTKLRARPQPSYGNMNQRELVTVFQVDMVGSAIPGTQRTYERTRYEDKDIRLAPNDTDYEQAELVEVGRLNSLGYLMPDGDYSYYRKINQSVINSEPQEVKFRRLNDVLLNPYETKISMINVPLLTLLTKLASLEEGSFKRSLVARVAKRLIEDRQDKILVTKTVNEFLFDGYRVDFMESVRELITDVFSMNFESPLPNNKFGFFYLKNNTWTKKENGELTVFSGRNKSMSDFMQVESWNDLKMLNVWPTNTEAGTRCNEIHGTDGSQFQPGVKRSQVLQIFSPQVCTSLYIKYQEDTQVRGIPLFRFTTPAELFAAPKKNAKNACYCTIGSSTRSSAGSDSTSSGHVKLDRRQLELQKKSKAERSSSQQESATITDARCYLDGLMDLSLCQRGAPVAASSPHFYNADPMLALVSGLKPNKELHETHIDIEPMTGAVLRAESRVQLNAYVEQAALRVVEPSVIGRMAPMVAPMLWLEESAEIDEKTSSELKRQLFDTVNKVRRTCALAIGVGLVLAAVLITHFWYFTCYKTSLPARNKPACKRVARVRRSGDQREARARDQPLLGSPGPSWARDAETPAQAS